MTDAIAYRCPSWCQSVEHPRAGQYVPDEWGLNVPMHSRRIGQVATDSPAGVEWVSVEKLDDDPGPARVQVAGQEMTAGAAEQLAGLLIEAARVAHVAASQQQPEGEVIQLRPADGGQDQARPVRNAVEVWRRDMTAQGLSQRTISDRVRVVAHAAGGSDPVGLGSDQVADYLARPGLTPSSKGTYAAALRAWFGWLQRTGRRDDNPMQILARPRVPAGQPRPVDTDAVRDVLASRLWPSTRAMILLAAYQGLRCAEIAAVRGQDIDITAGRLWVVGKGGRRASVLLHPEVVEVAARMPATGWWFPSPADAARPVSRASVSAVISRAFARVGRTGTAHQLRHWYATQLLASGATLREVQVLMRHSSLQHTARYLAVDEDHARAAVEGLPAL